MEWNRIEKNVFVNGLFWFFSQRPSQNYSRTSLGLDIVFMVEWMECKPGSLEIWLCLVISSWLVARSLTRSSEVVSDVECMLALASVVPGISETTSGLLSFFCKVVACPHSKRS